MRRAEKAGYKALAVTVDTPVLGRREADIRNKFSLPAHLTMGKMFHYISYYTTLCSVGPFVHCDACHSTSITFQSYTIGGLTIIVAVFINLTRSSPLSCHPLSLSTLSIAPLLTQSPSSLSAFQFSSLQGNFIGKGGAHADGTKSSGDKVNTEHTTQKFPCKIKSQTMTIFLFQPT